MRRDDAGARHDFLRIVGRLTPGTLWGHGIRSLIWNPIFALLPWVYLEGYAASSSLPISLFWLGAFVLGYPHALYTALEIRHFLMPRDGIAEGRTPAQAMFFGTQALFGGGLAVWYVSRGAEVLAARLGFDVHVLTAALALGGSAGAVVGLQDVLVMDVLLRPGRVVRAGVRALTSPPCVVLTLPTAITQFLLAETVLRLA